MLASNLVSNLEDWEVEELLNALILRHENSVEMNNHLRNCVKEVNKSRLIKICEFTDPLTDDERSHAHYGSRLQAIKMLADRIRENHPNFSLRDAKFRIDALID